MERRLQHQAQGRRERIQKNWIVKELIVLEPKNSKLNSSVSKGVQNKQSIKSKKRSKSVMEMGDNENDFSTVRYDP